MDVSNSIIIRTQSQPVRWFFLDFYFLLIQTRIYVQHLSRSRLHIRISRHLGRHYLLSYLFSGLFSRDVGSSLNMVGTNVIVGPYLFSLVGIGLSGKFRMSLYVPACLFQQQWHQPQKYMMNVFCRHHPFSLTEPAWKLFKFQVN